MCPAAETVVSCRSNCSKNNRGSFDSPPQRRRLVAGGPGSLLMNELVEVRGFPTIRQKADEWVGRGDFMESARVHLLAYLVFASQFAQDDGNRIAVNF